MKKILFYLLLILTVSCMSSCKSDETALPPTLEINDDIINFEPTTGLRKIVVETNVADWTAQVEENDKWCIAEPQTNNQLQIRVDANNELEKRFTKITVKAGGLMKTVNVTQLGAKPDILLSFNEKTVESLTNILDVVVTSNIEYDVLCNADWIQPSAAVSYALVAKTESFVIKNNVSQKNRTGTIEFKEKNGSVTKVLTITQKGASLDEDIFEADIKVRITKGEVANMEASPGGPIEQSFDGDYNTMYHSRWSGATVFPVTLTYYLGDIDKVDYATIHARKEGSNGHFKVFDVYAKKVGGSEYKIGTFDFKGEGGSKNVSLGVEHPEYIKYVIHSGEGGFASCGEMEFYKLNPKNVAADHIFTDRSCSALKPNVTLAQINEIESPLLRDIAEQLFNKTYDTKYRAQKYNAIASPSIIAKELKIGSGFSQYENITGMFIEKGKVAVLVGNTGGKSISLYLANLMRKPVTLPADKDAAGWGLKTQKVALNEGLNIIDVEYSTNAYIHYYDNNPETAPAITVNFPMGKVNGYFDASIHTNEDWNNLLNGAVSPIMDVRGKYIQVAYPVEFFIKNTYGKGVELINNYDKILSSHYEFMGLKKYNRLPKNRIFSRVNFNYYMFRDGDGVAYLGDESTMKMVSDPLSVIQGDPCWGFSHEVGHVLQMQPQLRWGGLGEVSNNLFSLYTTIALGNPSRLKENNKYALARKNIIDAKVSYLKPTDGDVFGTLVPFWQLHLYFSRNGKPTFYADLMEELRIRPHVGVGNESIRNQFEFIKLACDIGKTDLTDFFDKWGFFYVGGIVLDDYGDYSFVITQKEVDDTKSYIVSKGYAKPSMDITTIED